MDTSLNVREQSKTEKQPKIKATLSSRPLTLPPLHVCGALEVLVHPGATAHACQRQGGLYWEGCIVERVCGARGCVAKEGTRTSVGEVSETNATPRFTIRQNYHT